MVSGLLNVGKQGIGNVGQQLGLHAGGGVAVLAAHENAVQEDGAAVPLSPQGEQDGQGAGGYLPPICYEEYKQLKTPEIADIVKAKIEEAIRQYS